MYRWLPTHTRYTCYDSLEVAEVSQGPVTSLPSHSPRPPLKSRLSGCHLPIDFLAALFSGGGEAWSRVRPSWSPPFLIWLPPRHTSPVSRHFQNRWRSGFGRPRRKRMREYSTRYSSVRGASRFRGRTSVVLFIRFKWNPVLWKTVNRASYGKLWKKISIHSTLMQLHKRARRCEEKSLPISSLIKYYKIPFHAI